MLEEDDHNPFVLPSDGAEVFRLRENERKKQAAERERQRTLPIWQKTVRGGHTQLQKHHRWRPMKEEKAGYAQETRDLVAAARSQMAGERREEKENVAEFIAKKREMFLVQMSLDTKREEIRKLEAKAQAKEDALKKSEQMLEEDAIRFDAFLKENDKKAHEAIKRAERETKIKTDKVHEIKRLNQQIAAVSSDMSKHKEALEDCLKYKEFLDSLTPDEWFATQRKIKRKRQEERRNQRKMRNAAKKEQAAASRKKGGGSQNEDDVAASSEVGSVHGSTASHRGGRGAAASRKAAGNSSTSGGGGGLTRRKKELLDLNLESEELESSGDELPMYFKHPQQLLDVFSQLEEQNLFLIQNSQETEEALEELKQNFEATRLEMDGKTKLLKSNIESLESQIAEEEGKAEQLRGRLGARAGEGRQETLLAQLHDKVREVYQKCGFDVTSHPATLFMLSELEAKLEYLLEQIETMPEDYIVKEEKEKEKKRRERKRAEQQALQDALQEERNRKSVERSLQAPKKRTGRPVMFRSPPIRNTHAKVVKHDKKQDVVEEDEDDLKYFT